MCKLFTLLFASMALLITTQTMGQGCMGGGDDGAVSVIGFIQPEYRFSFDGVDNQGNAIPSENTFAFRRARLGVTGQIPYDFSYYAMMEFSPTLGGPYMLDVFITYQGLGPWANLTLGQFKPPFSLELEQPCHELHTINRALVTEELASPYRDMGFMAWGGWTPEGKDWEVLKWKLAVMNGTGLNKLDDNQGKDFVARLIISPWHWLKVGGSYKTGKQKPVNDTLPQDTRTRYGADLQVDLGNFKFQGEYIYGLDKGSSTEGGGCGQEPTVILGDFKKSGYYLMAMYMTPIRLQPVLKYEMYDPNMESSQDNNISTITVGLNYFFNDWTRLQVNYMYNMNDNPVKYFQQQFVVQVQAVIP